VPLGEWILRRACADAVAFPPHIKLAVNLSAAQFTSPDLRETVASALRQSGLEAARLELEITESVLLENDESNLEVLHALRSLGVAIVLDDFGTGFSSLGYITSFPVDKIKIDKSFTQGVVERADCAAVIASVLTLARALDITTTAEGIETEEQLEVLRAAGVASAQGYLLGRPVPADELGFTKQHAQGRPAVVA